MFRGLRAEPCKRCGLQVHARSRRVRFVLLNSAEIDADPAELAAAIGECASTVRRALKRLMAVHPCVAHKISDAVGKPVDQVAQWIS